MKTIIIAPVHRQPIVMVLLTIVCCFLGPGSKALNFAEISSSALASAEGQFLSGIWGDYDGDGRPDLFLNSQTRGAGYLFRNSPTGLALVEVGSVYEDVLQRASSSWGDMDNDGDLDLFVTGTSGDPNILYRNDGSLGFSRIISPFDVDIAVGMTTIWMDFDSDGILDLFVANGGGAGAQPNFLYRGSGNGQFEKISDGELVTEAQFSHGAAFADYDGDGDLDGLVMSAGGTPDSLFMNMGGYFVRTNSAEVGENSVPQGGTSAAWGDVDNDGDMDLLAVTGQNVNRFYLNDGVNGFSRVEDGVLTVGTDSTTGAVWADFDNDGWLDLVIVRRTGSVYLFRGLGDGMFERISNGTLAERTDGANGVAVADYDGDGGLDVLLTNWSGNSKPALFRNVSSANGWLRVKLEGTASNRSGIGAKVRVRATIGGETVWQMRQIGGFDSVGSHELVAHFGLGNAAQVDLVRIEWPSGIVQEIPNVTGRQILSVTEASTQTQSLSIEPNGGFFTNSVVVTLRSTVVGSQIRYTLDGVDPGPASTLYTAPLTITEAVTVKARLYVNNFPVSEVVSATFEPEPVLRFNPPGMWFTNQVEVVVQNRLTGASTRYTLDGSEPTLASPLYENPIALTATTSIRARAYLNGFPVSDAVVATYSRVVAFDDEGIPPAWRIQYFGEDYAINPQAAAEADPDGDGATNRQEYVAGTHPLDPLSGFRLGIRAIPEIRFHSVVGQKYRVLRLQELGGGVTTVVAEITAQGEETVWVDGSAEAALNPAFYLVEPVP
jgi:hypothetical protein